MKTNFIAALSAALLLSAGVAQASTHKAAPEMKAAAADCEKQAADKKLAGAAKASFVKKCVADAPAPAPAPAAAAKPTATADAPTAQQSKMTTCNKDAGDKKGDERKKFMSECLSSKKVTQQDKMKSCNKDAGDKALKGDERKKFMSECLKA